LKVFKEEIGIRGASPVKTNRGAAAKTSVVGGRNPQAAKTSV